MAVDVSDLKTDRFADAQAAAVSGHQQGARHAAGGSSEQALQLLGAQDLRQPARCPPRRDGQGDFRAFQGVRVKELEAGSNGVDRVPLQGTLGHEMEDVILHLLGRELIGRQPKVFGQPLDGLQIGFLRRRRVPP